MPSKSDPSKILLLFQQKYFSQSLKIIYNAAKNNYATKKNHNAANYFQRLQKRGLKCIF